MRQICGLTRFWKMDLSKILIGCGRDDGLETCICAHLCSLPLCLHPIRRIFALPAAIRNLCLFGGELWKLDAIVEAISLFQSENHDGRNWGLPILVPQFDQAISTFQSHVHWSDAQPCPSHKCCPGTPLGLWGGHHRWQCFAYNTVLADVSNYACKLR